MALSQRQSLRAASNGLATPGPAFPHRQKLHGRLSRFTTNTTPFTPHFHCTTGLACMQIYLNSSLPYQDGPRFEWVLRGSTTLLCPVVELPKHSREDPPDSIS